MAKKKFVTSKQIAVLEDIFSGDLDERAVLARHKVSLHVYNKWLADERFRVEYEMRLEGLRRESERLMARFASMAAAKLIELASTGRGETARKACLDIMLHLKSSNKEDAEETNAVSNEIEKLPPEVSSRILNALAEEKS